jgi:hypothetical protein
VSEIPAEAYEKVRVPLVGISRRMERKGVEETGSGEYLRSMKGHNHVMM